MLTPENVVHLCTCTGTLPDFRILTNNIFIRAKFKGSARTLLNVGYIDIPLDLKIKSAENSCYKFCLLMSK